MSDLSSFVMDSEESGGSPRRCPICGEQRGRRVAEPRGFPLIRCAGCSMVYARIDENFAQKKNRITDLRPLLVYYRNEPIETIAFYDRIIRGLVRFFGTSSPRILEFGCGSGMFMRRCRKAGLAVAGIDHSEYSSLAAEAFDLDVACTDLAAQPFAGEEFDVVFSHATFEHLVRPMEEAERLLSLLRPGGLFLTTGVPNFNTFTIRVLRNFWNNTPPGHINFFETRSLATMYRKLGLTQIRTWTYGFNLWYLQWHCRALQPPAKPEEIPPPLDIATVEEGRRHEVRREMIDKVRRLDTKLDTLEVPWPRALMAQLYTWARLPGAGCSVCARGVKPA